MSTIFEHPSRMSAQCILASRAPNGTALYTLHLVMPKFLDAEQRTHRRQSTNSSSSRAKPFQPPAEPPFLPSDVRIKRAGMQGNQPIGHEALYEFHQTLRRIYRYTAGQLQPWAGEIHKQHLNRYMEAFTLQDKVVTATEDSWNAFLRLRLSPHIPVVWDRPADPNIQIVAALVAQAIEAAKPRDLRSGEWHLPYVTGEERARYQVSDLMRASAARCARASYGKHGVPLEPDMDKRLLADIDRAEQLQGDEHMTPFEHQATPMEKPLVSFPCHPDGWEKGVTHIDRLGMFWSGNFHSWIQYRQLVDTWMG